MLEEYIENLNKKHDALLEKYSRCHAALMILRGLLEEHFETGTELRLESVNLALKNTDLPPIRRNNER